MSDIRFLGAGLHTRLGKGVAANLAVMNTGIPEPSILDVPFGDEVERIPYHVIDLPMTGPQRRLDSIVHGVIEEAVQSAGLSEAELQRAALVIGTSSLDISVSEQRYREDLIEKDDPHPLIPSSSLGNLANRIQTRLGMRGMDYTINTACTASANALVMADAMISAGEVDHALVLGVEVFNSITALGFHGLELIAKNGIRPFDADRGGLVLGEGCSAMILGRGEGRFRLLGGANMCDTSGISAANPDGSTVAEVIGQALASAGVSASEITAAKTHGTASLLNDEAEAAGLHIIFETLPPLCALKPYLGHTFGACGLNELILLCAALDEGFLPATPGISAEAGDLNVSLPQTPLAVPRGKFLLNHFGFGGNNTSIVIAND